MRRAYRPRKVPDRRNHHILRRCSLGIRNSHHSSRDRRLGTHNRVEGIHSKAEGINLPRQASKEVTTDRPRHLPKVLGVIRANNPVTDRLHQVTASRDTLHHLRDRNNKITATFVPFTALVEFR